MSEGQSVADLLLKIGVDAGEMISGFNGTARQARQMAKDMAEGINASLQKAFDPATVDSGRILEGLQTKFTAARKQLQESSQQSVAVTQEEAARRQELINVYNQERSAARKLTAEKKRLAQETDNASAATVRSMSAFDQMFQNLETQYRATVSTMLRESIEARAVIERSAENVKRFALEAAEADQRVMGELLTEQANFYNVKQGLRTAELANIQATANQELEIQQRSLDMQAALRKRYAAEIAAFEAESAVYRQQRVINEANQRDVLQFYSRRDASLKNMKATADAETEIIERSTALREAILARYGAKTQEELAAEKRAREMIVEQQERSNEALKFSNKLRREAVVFMKQLEEAGIDPESEKYKAMTAEFRRQQQMQRDEYQNRDAIIKQKEDEARLDADALAVMRMTMTAQEAHNARIARYDELLEKGKISQERYNAAVRKSKEIMQSQDVGTGGISGVIAQLSFGLEDFAQGIAMGDFRAAMLGASNNITMVVRGLQDMDSAARIAAFSAMKVPLGFAGLAAAAAATLAMLHHIRNANTELKSLSDRIAEATRQYFRFRQADELATRQERRTEELKNITDIEGIESKRRQAELDHADLIRKLETERNENNVKGREAILKMLGGEANMIELQQHLTKQNTVESQMALQALARAQQAALQGNAAVVFAEMKSLFEYLDAQANLQASGDLGRLIGTGGSMPGSSLFDMAALNELQKYFKQGTLSNAFYGDSEEALKEIQTVLDQIAKDESKSLKERADAEKALEDIKKRQLEIDAERVQREQFEAEQLKEKLEREHQIRKQRAEFEAESFRLMQQEQLFLINATESEREILRLKEQQAKVTRPGAFMTGFDPILNALIQQENAALQQQDQMAFLEAQKKAAENEIIMLQQQAIPKAQGALEQDAFQAQADAFKQMTENLTQKPNPQLTQVVNRLGAIEAAIKNGGVFLQVGP